MRWAAGWEALIGHWRCGWLIGWRAGLTAVLLRERDIFEFLQKWPYQPKTNCVQRKKHIPSWLDWSVIGWKERAGWCWGWSLRWEAGGVWDECSEGGCAVSAGRSVNSAVSTETTAAPETGCPSWSAVTDRQQIGIFILIHYTNSVSMTQGEFTKTETKTIKHLRYLLTEIRNEKIFAAKATFLNFI